MGKFYSEIPNELMQWIEKQHVFWVATAPLHGNGHVNVSPKGVPGTFHLVDSKTCWYEDLTGSGIETISHLREEGNGRITILFNAFEGPPKIARLFGRGTVYEVGSPEYESRILPGQRNPGSRAVIVIDIHKVGTSCGFAVPLYKFEKHRTILHDWSNLLEKRDIEGELGRSGDGMLSWWAGYNVCSIDGLAGLEIAAKLATQPAKASINSNYFRGSKVKATIVKTQPLVPQKNNLIGWQFGVGLVIGLCGTLLWPRLVHQLG